MQLGSSLPFAVPAVVPRVLRGREWVKDKTTHVKFFGSSWVFEMATALLLVDKFSDTGNLKYNLGITDERGNTTWGSPMSAVMPSLSLINHPRRSGERKCIPRRRRNGCNSPTAIICVSSSRPYEVRVALRTECKPGIRCVAVSEGGIMTKISLLLG